MKSLMSTFSFSTLFIAFAFVGAQQASAIDHQFDRLVCHGDENGGQGLRPVEIAIDLTNEIMTVNGTSERCAASLENGTATFSGPTHGSAAHCAWRNVLIIPSSFHGGPQIVGEFTSELTGIACGGEGTFEPVICISDSDGTRGIQ